MLKFTFAAGGLSGYECALLFPLVHTPEITKEFSSVQ